MTRYGDGCLNGTHLVSSTQQPTKYDVISFNYGVSRRVTFLWRAPLPLTTHHTTPTHDTIPIHM